MDRLFKRFDFPTHNIPSLGIREFMDQLHYDVVRKMDALVFSAFRSLGYTNEWVIDNRKRISVTRMVGSPSPECMIYHLDGRPLFSVTQITEIKMENGKYQFLANWEVNYL